MRSSTFKGGVHPDYNKDRTSGVEVRPLEAPAQVAIPLSQHIGAPASPFVQAGDEVLVGQMVGEPGGFVSASVHSSVSGTVAAVEPRPGVMGLDVPSVIIDNDNEYRPIERDGLGDGWKKADLDKIKDLIRDGGLVGMGGAAFPTHVKLSPPPDKKIDTVILNGAECEPYLTADHRVMLENPADVVLGLRIFARVLGAERIMIAVETNKQDALEAIRAEARGHGVEIVPLSVKYPQGAEKQIIDACLRREVPTGGLPMDVGVVVQNVGTSAAVADAVVRGRALTERVITVTGDAVAEPANLLVKVGTPVSALLETCNADMDSAAKLVMGGPMMGIAQSTASSPVTKGTSGVLLLSKKHVYEKSPAPCIKCGRCVRSCPMRLVPTEIAMHGLSKDPEGAKKADALDCVECGSCAHDCPSRIPLVQEIRLAKAAINAAARREREAK